MGWTLITVFSLHSLVTKYIEKNYETELGLVFLNSKNVRSGAELSLIFPFGTKLKLTLLHQTYILLLLGLTWFFHWLLSEGSWDGNLLACEIHKVKEKKIVSNYIFPSISCQDMLWAILKCVQQSLNPKIIQQFTHFKPQI